MGPLPLLPHRDKLLAYLYHYTKAPEPDLHKPKWHDKAQGSLIYKISYEDDLLEKKRAKEHKQAARIEIREKILNLIVKEMSI